MEPIKKRRNSILKKKTTEEDITTEIKARRISFSGKKSVKEFIAGEEAATIWGTSYEESADDLKASSSESGLVNVHVKRIQLRNRRVICEPQQQKRRSSLKRKVLIAQNDKENLCVMPNPPPVEIEQEVKPPTLPAIIIETPQSKSPVESELALVRSDQNVSKSLETMPQKKLVIESSSICSSTFDFINLSAKINKTITIENSLDVSLKESELQMFKFRVPVRATETSPNTSNILCRSIQMSDDDKNILKMVRKQKGGKNIAKEKITDEEFNLIETKKTDVPITDMSKTDFEETLQQNSIAAGISSNSIEVPQIHDGKGSKRKSERTLQSFVLDSTLVEINSPLRKKAMHTLYGSSMDVTNNMIENISQMETNGRSTIYDPVGVDESIVSHKEKPSGRPTIHFDSVLVEESAVGMHSLFGTNTPSHTVYDSKTINESSSFPNTTASCLAMGNQTDGFSIEISMSAQNENTQTQEYIHMNGNGLQTQSLSIPKSSETIYASSDVEEITVPTNQMTKASKNQRESIYTSIYMDEESPKPSKTLKANNTKGLKLRQTILTAEGIIEDIPSDVDPPKCILQKTITTRVNIFEDSIQAEPHTKGIKTNRQTIYDAVEIKEDITLSQQVNVFSEKNRGKRVSDYNPTDMIQESPKAYANKTASAIGLQKRQTIFNPEDIVEDIPTNLLSNISLKLGMTSKPSTKNRQTVFETVDIELDAVPLEKNKARQSIYTTSDMIEDSPKRILPQSKGIVSSDCIKARSTIVTPTDIIEDLTREFPSQDAFKKTMEESVYMLEESVRAEPVSKTIADNDSFEIEEPVGNVHRIGPNKSYKSTQSVYSPSEMLEDSLKPAPSHTPQISQVPYTLKCRQTISTPEDIVEDSINENEAQYVLQKTTKIPINIFEDSLNSELISKTSTIENCQTKREESSINSADIEIVTEPIQNVDRSSKINKSRESIYTPSDMIEVSPTSTRPIKAEPKLGDLKTNHTVFNPEDLVEDLPNEFASRSVLQRTNKSSLCIVADPATEQIPKSRQTIYEFADIEEVTVPIQQAISKSITTAQSLIKNRKTVYDTIDIEQATESIKPGFVWNKSNMSMTQVHTPQDVVEEFPICIQSQKQDACSKSIFIPEEIHEDTINEIQTKNFLQNTIKTPINIFEDSVQEEPALKEVVKDRQTIYEIADIVAEDYETVQPARSISLIRKPRNSNNIPNEITMQIDCTKSNVKRQTTYNQVDISLDSATVPQIPAENEIKKNQNPRTTIYEPSDIVEDLPKTIKERAPSKIQVFRRELSSTDLTAKQPVPLQAGKIQKNVAVNSNQLQNQCSSKAPQFSYAVHQANMKKRQSIHTPVDMVEDSPQPVKSIQPSTSNTLLRKTEYEPCDIATESPLKPIQPFKSNTILRKTLYEPCDITTDSPKSTSVEKMHQITVKSQTDITIDSTVPTTDKSSQKNNRQTVHTHLDMMEDSPLLIQPFKSNAILRKTLYEPCDITTDSPKSTSVEKMHQITVKSQTDITIDSTVPTTDKSSQKNNRQTVHTHLDMMEDSPLLNRDGMGVELEEKETREHENKPGQEEIDDKLEKGSDMPFRKPTKLFSETYKSLDNPYSSTKSLMDKVMQEMGYSMNFQFEFAPEAASQKLSPPNSQVASMNFSVLQDVNKEAISAVNSMELSISNETHLNKPKQQTMYLSEGIEVEVENDKHDQSRNNEFYKTSFDESRMDLSTNDAVTNPPKMFDYQQNSVRSENLPRADSNQYLSPFTDETINNESSNQTNAIVEEHSPKPELAGRQASRRRTVHLNEDLELDDRPETSLKDPLQKLNRQTMNLNEKIEEIEEVKNEQQSSKQLSFQVTKHQCRKTIFLNQDLDLCEIDDSQNIPPTIHSQDYSKTYLQTYHDESKGLGRQVIPQRPNRQTIHLNHDLDLSETPEDDLQKVLVSNKTRRTNYLNQDVDVDESQEIDTQMAPQRPNRQTIHLNQDLDFSKIDDLQKVPPGDSVKTNQRINYFNQDLDVDKHQDQGVSQRPNRQTIYFNQELEGDDHQQLDMSLVSGEELISPNRATNSQQSYEESGRRTIYFQHEVDIEDNENTNHKSITKQQLTPVQKGNEHSLHEEIKFDDEYAQRKKLFNETKKNTEENACRFSITDKSDLDRKSVYFNNKPEFITTQNRQTVYFTNNISLDESVQPSEDDKTMNPSIANRNCCLNDEKEVSAKLVSRPKRVTICDAQPLDMDESLLPKSTARKSSFSRTLNFDEIPTMRNEMSHQKSKLTLQSASKDDDSPIYNPSLRPKVPMTPSEVDRSLAEYLKLEAAIDDDQEEEIFYDAEDGTEIEKQNKRQTCHVPVNILEESGMQPLQSDIMKRKTTFSPKEMTNDSLDHGQSKLAAKDTNTEFTILHNETHQNASHNQMHKQTVDKSHKGLFQKTIETNDKMEVTQMHDSTKNTKPILMEPRLGGTNFDVQRNRQTLYFNESINIADVSTACKPSSSVQSVKELLLENARLFSQSNLLKPSIFEDKRSTLFSTGNDDSMDVRCIESGPTDPEITPTKNKISRIPQLIGSAKKLESLKKSMEFIQQELPNIGCHLRNNETYDNMDESLKDQETPRRFSTTIPKKLQELEESFNDGIKVPQEPFLSATDKTVKSEQNLIGQLQESFDTIDIPRKVLSSVRKTIEESPQREAREKEEIPRRTFSVNPIELQESFDVVDIPRRGTTFQRNDTLYICPNEKEMTMNASQKSLFQLEDPPITISDVSTFFSQKLATYSPNTTEALCKSNVNVNEIQALSRSPDSEDTTHNLAHFKKRYVDLTCDSISLPDSSDNIEKTHLSLVNTLDDESEMVQSLPKIQMAVEMSPPPAKVQPLFEMSPPPAKVQPLKPKSSVCRKCKCQRLSVTQNDTTIGSFMLEPLPVYKIDLSEFEELAKQPSISDVGNFFRQKIRESDSFNVSDGSQSVAMDDEDVESIENLLKEIAEGRLANAQKRQQKRKEIKIENSFRYKVRRKIQSNSKWMINDLLLYNNVIVLTHTRIRTFTIIIYFTPKDPRGVDVIFNDIQFKPNRLHTRHWKPYEYALHYQLLVELPFDLKTICPTCEHFFDFFDHLEKVTKDVLRTGNEMLSIILPSPASLIREPSGRLYIRKYVRTKTQQNDVKKTEIHIEVRNVKKLSYESIAMPPLYEFDENIQLLPLGNDFLRTFLDDPLKFIKT